MTNACSDDKQSPEPTWPHYVDNDLSSSNQCTWLFIIRHVHNGVLNYPNRSELIHEPIQLFLWMVPKTW